MHIRDYTQLRAAIDAFDGDDDKRRLIQRAARHLGLTAVLPRDWRNNDRIPLSTASIENALRRKSEASGIPVVKLRCVYLRGVEEFGDSPQFGITASGWGQARVNSFIRRANGDWTARRDDMDLLPLVAVGRGEWDESLHPRDRLGRWIDKIGSIVKIFGNEDKPDAGEVYASTKPGEIWVRITDSNSGLFEEGDVVPVNTDLIEMIDAQARLDDPDLPKEGLSPEHTEAASGPLQPGTMVRFQGEEWRVAEVFGDEVAIERDDSDFPDIVPIAAVTHLGREQEVSLAPVQRSVGRFDAWGDRADEIQRVRDQTVDIDELASHVAARNFDVFNQIFHARVGNTRTEVTDARIRNTPDGRMITVTGSVLTDDETRPNGVREAGAFQREIQLDVPGGPSIFNESFEIADDIQGQGLATQFYRNQDNWAIANGVRDVRLHANIDIGGYAWARAGFDWDTTDMYDPDEVMGNFENVVTEAGISGNQEWLSQAQELHSRAAQAFVDDRLDLLPTPFELAHVGWTPGAEMWPGKSGMLGSSWSAIKNLVPERESFRNEQETRRLTNDTIMNTLSGLTYQDLIDGDLPHGMKIENLMETGEAGKMGDTHRIIMPDGREFYVKWEDYSMYADNEIDAAAYLEALDVPGRYRVQRNSTVDNMFVMESAGQGLKLQRTTSPRHHTFHNSTELIDAEELAQNVNGGEDHLLKMALFDAATGNIDRHEANVVLGHDVDGTIHVLPVDHAWAMQQHRFIDPTNILDTRHEDGADETSLYATLYAAAIRSRRRSLMGSEEQAYATADQVAKFQQVIAELRAAAERSKMSDDAKELVYERLDKLNQDPKAMVDLMLGGTAVPDDV